MAYCTDDFFDRLLARASTIDELLSEEFETQPGQKGDAERAARRLAAWCQSCASGNWLLFSERLKRDDLSLLDVLGRFATARRAPSASLPLWVEDAMWIEAALRNSLTEISRPIGERFQPVAFEHLLAPLVMEADLKLQLEINEDVSANLSISARADLRHALLRLLSDLLGELLYELFTTKCGEARSIYSAMECVRRGNRPKPHISRVCPGFPKLQYIFGKPEKIVVDNGKEFVGTSFRLGMADLGIKLEISGVGRPTHKSIGERFFETIKETSLGLRGYGACKIALAPLACADL